MENQFNYFNYFTEIEEQFLRRRGGGLLLTTLDWALIETWKDAGIPLEAALRGIDAAFDRYDQRPSKTKKVNSLAYCSQEVLAAAEDMKEAAVGAAVDQPSSVKSRAGQGFEPETIAAFLRRNADLLEPAKLPHSAESPFIQSPQNPPPRCASWRRKRRTRKHHQGSKTWSAISPCWRKNFSPRCSPPLPTKKS